MIPTMIFHREETLENENIVPPSYKIIDISRIIFPRNTCKIGYRAPDCLVDNEIMIGINGVAGLRVVPLKDEKLLVEIGGVNVMEKIRILEEKIHILEEKINQIHYAPGMPGYMLAQQDFIKTSE